MKPCFPVIFMAIVTNGCSSWGGFWYKAAIRYGEPANIMVLGRAISSYAPTVTGDAKIAVYGISPVQPSGLSFDTKTGTITGTPLIAGTTSHTVTGYNSGGEALTTAALTLNIFDFGSGKSGSVTISAPGTIVNTCTHITNSSIAAGSTSITVGSAAGFSNGDLILVAQMQNASGVLPSEFATISTISVNTLTLSSALKNSYSSNNFNAAASNAAQVVRVPEYTDFTVTAAGSVTTTAWTGQSGGIIAFRASGTVTLNGAVNAGTFGFRGGAGVLLGSAGQAFQGESYPGFGIASSVANAGGGGGGANSANNTNAGGGLAGYAVQPLSVSVVVVGNGFVGTIGAAGNALSNPTLSNFYLGSGGGGHGQGVSQCGGPVANGGPGGGIIIIDAYQIEIGTGSIDASGSPNNNCVWAYQPSGPGSGGSIYLRSYIQHLGTNLVSVTGGYMRGDSNAGVAYSPNTASDGLIRTDFTNPDGSSRGTPKQTPVYSATTTVKSPLQN